ncbi:hypothetical protein BD410DRAFT_639315 [Rickenella mellea]|uniref:Uncharacterized protein n=1 Tax=Rickenella mellea TaxID=50990 RepID=A0A4Y7QDF7_9AGAM|nr:hypothetical protein BD410DRAFT_639315 [Rickenella mellea]
MSNDRKVLKLPTVPKGVDRVSQTVDNIHDKIATANANITQAVTTAKKAMSGVSMSDVMSMTPRECLIPLKRVMDALNLIKGIHPFVGLAVTAFEVVLSLEMKRRENDKRVSGIFLKKADMMMALLQLDTIKDVDMKNDQGETVAGRMQTIIAAIKKDIETCGNVIDTYYDQKFLAKFLRAGSWEDTFIGFASIFEKRKEDIKLALAIHVTIKMDIVADQVSSIDVKMDMLIRLFKDQSPKEKTLAAKVEELGGIEECIRSDRLLAQLDKPSDGEPVGSTVSQSLKPSTSLLVSVRTPLETLFDDHKAYFDVLIKSETKWIDNAIQRSTRRIISAIGDGPWKRIQDLDIRQVWKGMNAPSSVKARYFVLALHDHYIDQYENISALASIQLDRDIVPPSPTLSHAETEATNGDVDTGFLQNPPPEADKWCLEYLSIQNIPAIAEAIDDDVSGFIKIAEVNNFSYDKPEGFSMLRWVTFWAAGSAVEASIYHVRIEALIEKLLDVPVKAENRGESYPDYTYCLLCISWLLRSRPHVTTENAELIDLIRQHMKLQEKAITDSLEPAKWEIDQAGTVSTLLGPGRIEKYLYPTLYLVLRYHYQVLSLGSTHVLDDREIEAAYNTLWSLLDACDTRMSVLAAAFDQQPGVDGFKRFAGGLFKNWNTRNPISRQSEVPIDAMPPFELKDEEYAMEDQLEYSPGTVISLESLLQGHDPRVGHHELDVGQLHYGIVDTSKQLDESEDHRAYIDLYKKQIILEYADDELNDVDTAKMKELECIPESERHSCQQIASREISKGGYQ